LVVAVIIAAVMGLAIKDAFRYARESANQRKCLSNLRVLWSASMMYAQDYDGWLPVYVNSRDRSGRGNLLKGFPSPEKLHSCLSRYVRDQSAWFCPGALSAPKREYADSAFDPRYSNYDFHFCKPGTLRSDGLHAVPPRVTRRKPNLYALIMDEHHFLTRAGGKQGGPHPDGVINVVYLDGHLGRITFD